MLLTAVAVTPVIEAFTILVASAVTVVPASVTDEPLIVIVFPLVSVGLATVPEVVGQLVCQAELPTSTHALLRFL